ncbi:hypothetical protein PENSPDRAFT_694415 [Peniophora sp. CONT]|nr:hypothetical protein PENSPDRAFT_694415 [Peniophora sp. CONT]
MATDIASPSTPTALCLQPTSDTEDADVPLLPMHEPLNIPVVLRQPARRRTQSADGRDLPSPKANFVSRRTPKPAALLPQTLHGVHERAISAGYQWETAADIAPSPNPENAEAELYGKLVSFVIPSGLLAAFSTILLGKSSFPHGFYCRICGRINVQTSLVRQDCVTATCAVSTPAPTAPFSAAQWIAPGCQPSPRVLKLNGMSTHTYSVPNGLQNARTAMTFRVREYGDGVGRLDVKRMPMRTWIVMKDSRVNEHLPVVPEDGVLAIMRLGANTRVSYTPMEALRVIFIHGNILVLSGAGIEAGLQVGSSRELVNLYAIVADSYATQASAIAAKQLDAVIRVRLGGTGTDATAVEKFLALAYAYAHIDIHSLVSYRTAAWSLKEDRLTVAAASAAPKSWHDALWSSDAPGPAPFALDALGTFETDLDRQAGLLTFGDSAPRSDKIARLYRNTVLLLLCCFPDDSDTGAQQQLLDAYPGQNCALFLAVSSHPGLNAALEEEADAAGQSLYRYKVIESDAINDAEIETQGFHALFPDYENVLVEGSDADKPTSTSASSHAGSARIQALIEAYMYLIGSSGGCCRVNPTARFVQLRKTAAQQLLDAHGDVLPDARDKQLYGFPAAMLGAPSSVGKSFDFYLGDNVPEVRKATQVVQAMARRLHVSIAEWSEQMVLQHLLARCEQVLRLNIHSPVTKVLEVMEQLLVQSEDWEKYANRENMLKEHREALTSLIDAVSEWWFRTYSVCIRGLFDVVDSTGDLDKFLDELVPLVENFVTSTPLGQYGYRLDTALGFERLIKMLAQQKPTAHGAALDRLSRLLASTRAKCSQFAHQVAASLSTQWNAMEKSVKNFTKLASWRDVNVQSLKANAIHTHSQLYKSIRKFRDILLYPSSSPTTPHLRPLLSPLHLEQLTHLPPPTCTYDRFSTLITSRVDSFLGSSPHSALRELAHEAITTANEPIPADGPAERRGKLGKALLVRKCKAWSGWLKELKRIGMAYSVQPQVFEQQGSARWLREQPAIPSAGDAIAEVVHIKSYYMKLSGLVPQLRASLSTTSAQQITTSGSNLQRKLQRQHDDMARLVHALAESTELCNMLGDLPSIASAPPVLVEMTSPRADWFSLRDQLSARMPNCVTPIVLLDEYEIATASTELIKRTNQRLREWTDKETHPPLCAAL